MTLLTRGARRRPGRPLLALAGVAAVAAVAVAVAVGLDDSGRAASTSGSGAPAPQSSYVAAAKASTAMPGSRYATAVDHAVAHGLVVWVDADIAGRWLQGSHAFGDAVHVAGLLAQRPGVRGIRVADELGYEDGFGSFAKVRQFLVDTRAAVRAVAPNAAVVVDVVLPELGCGAYVASPAPGQVACAEHARARYPQLALTSVDSYLADGSLDGVNLSPDLLSDSQCAVWGTTRDAVMSAAWAEVNRRGWSARVTMRARKALAHPGAYSAGPSVAQADVRTFVDLPIAGGAHAVDVWTWRQLYDGSIVRIFDPRLAVNDLVQALRASRAAGASLLTQFSPSSVETTLDGDLTVMASLFDGVYVAAGTG